MSGQSAYANQLLGFPGQRVGSGHQAHSCVNDLGMTRQVSDLTVSTAADATVYTFTLDGVTVSVTSGTGATTTTIRDQLLAEYRTKQQLETSASGQPYSTNKIRFTASVRGTAFVLDESDSNLAHADVTANVAQVSIPFGRALVRRQSATLQVATLTISAVNSTAYALTVAGYRSDGVAVLATSVGYTSDGSATTTEIRDGLLAALALLTAPGGALEGVCYGTALTSSTFSVSSAHPGVAITVAESDANLTLAQTVANVAPSGLANDRSAVLPSLPGQKFLGVLERIHSIVDPSNANASYPQGAASPGQDMTAVFFGKMLVETDQAVQAGDPVYFRTAAGSGLAADVGKFRKDADSGAADLLQRASFTSSLAGAGVAEVLLVG